MASPSALNIIISLFNLILNSRHFPSQWNFGLITNIHKGGNNDDPNNYRGITLSSNLGNLFCTVPHERLSNLCDHNNIIAKEQAAFRKGYTATDHVFLLKTIVNKYNTKQKAVYLLCRSRKSI